MNLFNNGYLTKFNSLDHTLFNVSVEFMENYIFESDQKKIILQNLDDLHVFILPFDKSLKNILDNDIFNFVKKNHNYIIGFILLDESAKTDKLQYIDYIDTRIKKHNLASHMIQLYEQQNNIILVPYDILKSASSYWKKYFERKYNIKTINALDNWVNSMNIKKNIKWDHLIDLY